MVERAERKDAQSGFSSDQCRCRGTDRAIATAYYEELVAALGSSPASNGAIAAFDQLDRGVEAGIAQGIPDFFYDLGIGRDGATSAVEEHGYRRHGVR